jgi:hypothetical protein
MKKRVNSPCKSTHRSFIFWCLTKIREWFLTGVRMKTAILRTLMGYRHNNLELAIPEGIEPSTCRLEVGCSIQLSYGTAQGVFCGVGGRLASRLRVKE